MTSIVKSMRGLQPGEEAVIEKIAVAGEIGRRIRDMGLIPGTRFLVIGRAPLRDRRLTLGRGIAEKVLVD